MNRRTGLLLPLLLAGCLTGKHMEEEHMIQTNPPDLAQYQQMLESMRSVSQQGTLNRSQVEQAMSLAQGLPGPEQAQALDLLKQTVSQHGSADAKAFYSLNPELNLIDVFSAVAADAIPAKLRKLADPQSPGLSLEAFRQLPPADRQLVLDLARKAQAYYLDKAEAMRSAVNPISEKADSIASFLLQAAEAAQDASEDAR
ncbi:MAG TPA: hypothetical protein V6D23_07120 [Candidatus Obscuribacterales bacterium]